MKKLSKSKRSPSVVGRFLLDVIKPVPVLQTLGKRTREDDSTEAAHTTVQGPPVARSTTTPAPTPALASRPPCVALQNEDKVEDAVVITALNVIPFCCHADLITMSRTELLKVAATMNAKLPLAMQIDADSSCSDASIRHSIELLVGLRHAHPETELSQVSRSRSIVSNATNATSDSKHQAVGSPPNPASSLASRSRRNVTFPNLSLDVLKEDSEEDPSEGRGSKRRRTDAPLPFDVSRPITRAQSRRVAPLLAQKDSTPKAIGAAAGARVLRAHSSPAFPGTPTRASAGSPRRSARTRNAHGSKAHGFTMTSTPKKRTVAAVNSPDAGARRFGSLLADVQNTQRATRDSTSNIRRFVGKAFGGDESTTMSFGMDEVTFGLEGMTMPLRNSRDRFTDLDISSG